MLTQYDYLSGPLEIVLNITNSCNLDCMHCFNNSNAESFQHELPDNVFLGVVDDICKLKPYNVCFSGGEPLLREKLLMESIERFAAQGIRVSMVTNGTLLDNAVLKKLISAGITEISISLDGMNPQTHNFLRHSESAYQSTLNALELLKHSRFELYDITFTITKLNAEELEDFLLYFIAQGHTRFAVRSLVTAGRAVKNIDILEPSILQYRKIRSMINKFSENTGILIKYCDSLNHIFIFRKAFPFFAMEMKADGSLIPSPYIPYKLGNVLNHSIKEYWDSGWPKVWELQALKQLVSSIKSSNDLPAVYETALNSTGLDLIDSSEAGECI